MLVRDSRSIGLSTVAGLAEYQSADVTRDAFTEYLPGRSVDGTPPDHVVFAGLAE